MYEYTEKDIPADLADHFIKNVYKNSTNLYAVMRSAKEVGDRLMHIADAMERDNKIDDKFKWVNEHPLISMYLAIMVDCNDGQIYYRTRHYMLVRKACTL